jgi:hypothetical protein
MAQHTTAQFVATQHYADSDALIRALHNHNGRVIRARLRAPGSALALEPLLTVSGTTVMRLMEGTK